jgi:hypothetical protein
MAGFFFVCSLPFHQMTPQDAERAVSSRHALTGLHCTDDGSNRGCRQIRLHLVGDNYLGRFVI